MYLNEYYIKLIYKSISFRFYSAILLCALQNCVICCHVYKTTQLNIELTLAETAKTFVLLL